MQTSESQMSEVTKPKYKGKIQDNYDSYLKKNLIIGNTDKFKEDSTHYSATFKTKCRGFEVEFGVRHCRVSFAEGKYFCDVLVTDRCDVGKKLGAFSFGSMSYIDESKSMEEAVVALAKELNLMICDKANSWPYAVAIVQENFFVE